MSTRTITLLSAEVLGHQLLGNGGTVPFSGAWPTANKAFFIPFRLRYPMLAQKLLLQVGAAANGNMDAGLFDGETLDVGPALARSGAIAQASAHAKQALDITDVELLAEHDYYFAVSLSSTSGTLHMVGVPPLGVMKGYGVRQQLSAHPLPATPTPADLATNVSVPFFGIAGRAVA